MNTRHTFFPSPGHLSVFRPPIAADIRVETGYGEGGEVTPHYDPMIAKVIARAPTRALAIAKPVEALEAFEIRGTKTNVPFLLHALHSPEFAAGDVHMGIVPLLVKRMREETVSNG